MTGIVDHVVATERYQELLAALTPMQLAVVALLVNGDVADPVDAGELLGLGYATAGMRLEAARKRLLARFPELRSAVAGRSLRGNGVKHSKGGRRCRA